MFIFIVDINYESNGIVKFNGGLDVKKKKKKYKEYYYYYYNYEEEKNFND